MTTGRLRPDPAGRIRLPHEDGPGGTRIAGPPGPSW